MPDKEKPSWVTDGVSTPPWPIMRCPTCKALFDNNGLHICAEKFLHPSFRKGASDAT